ncbi:MAG: threonine/serine exporter family protein [Lachnospiraceae bacterium]
MKELLQIGAAFIACSVFAILYNAQRNKILLCGLGGAISWISYIVIATQITNIFTISMLSAIVVTAYAEALARYTKCPATIYLIPSILPLVPGGSLYYTTNALVTNNKAQFAKYGQNTLYAALGIAIGIVVISIFVYYFNRYRRSRTNVPS